MNKFDKFSIAKHYYSREDEVVLRCNAEIGIIMDAFVHREEGLPMYEVLVCIEGLPMTRHIYESDIVCGTGSRINLNQLD